MELFDLVLWFGTETYKNILIGLGILGMGARRGGLKWIVMSVGAAVVFAAWALPIPVNMSLLQLSYSLLVVLLFFEERFVKRVQAFLLQLIAITSCDLYCWSVIASLAGKEVAEGTPFFYWISWGSEIAGCFVWTALCLGLRAHREAIHKLFEGISAGLFLMLMSVLLGLALMAGITQGRVLGHTGSYFQKVYLSASAAVLLLVLILGCFFVHTAHEKRQLERENAFTEECIRVQKLYYDRQIAESEDMKRFRHDISKHFGLLKAMCERDDMEGVREYIQALDIQYIQGSSKVRTGHFVADFFLNQTVEELLRDGELSYAVVGSFPENINVANGDLCILFGNALENACEALRRVASKRRLVFTVETFKEDLFLTISNTAADGAGLPSGTTKGDREHHGYGITNMKRVAGKYGGDVGIRTERGMFVLEIELRGVVSDTLSTKKQRLAHNC